MAVSHIQANVHCVHAGAAHTQDLVLVDDARKRHTAQRKMLSAASNLLSPDGDRDENLPVC